MIFISRPQKYSDYGTYLPDCDVIPFSTAANDMNIGGIGINSASVNAVRVVGVKLGGTDYYFNNQVVVIDRQIYGVSGIISNASELVGNQMRTLYKDEFDLIKIPFLFTIGWEDSELKNYTAHAIDSSTTSGIDNSNANMIYQFRDNFGVWSGDYGSGTYNLLTTSSLAINSDIDPYMRCSLENIQNIEIKSLFTSKPDIILSGIADNPLNINILLTYVSDLSFATIDQLFYPVLQKNNAVNCNIDRIGAVNMSITLKNNLISKGWDVNF